MNDMLEPLGLTSELDEHIQVCHPEDEIADGLIVQVTYLGDEGVVIVLDDCDGGGEDGLKVEHFVDEEFEDEGQQDLKDQGLLS